MRAPLGFRAERCPCGYRWEDCPRRDVLGPGRAANAGPASACPGGGGRLARPALSLLCAFGAALAATPATAAHCPNHEIWRIRLDKCVDAQSALALPYVRSARRGVASHGRPAFIPDNGGGATGGPSTAPPKPAPDQEATLAEPIVLPDLEDGVPTIWRLCQAAPNLCKPSEAMTGDR
jgi:hypothetical protein